MPDLNLFLDLLPLAGDRPDAVAPGSFPERDLLASESALPCPRAGYSCRAVAKAAVVKARAPDISLSSSGLMFLIVSQALW
jgi:hypothetical protein